MDAGIISGIAGFALGVAGGLIGTYFSIKNTKGPRERRFMIRAAIAAWMAVVALLTGLFLFPSARVWVWGAYGLLLPVGIIWLNRRQCAIQPEEQAQARPD